MSLKMFIPIIAIVSVAIMIVWGTLTQNWSYCWLAPFIGGCAMAIISIIEESRKKEQRNKDRKEI